MASRGRKPALLKLPTSQGGGKPTKPKTIRDDEVASKLWDALVKDLVAASILAPSDGPVLAALCSAFSRFVRCREILATEDWVIVNDSTGAVKAHPLLGVEAGAANEINRYASELGLSPTARARITRVADESKEQSLDDLLA